MSTDVRMGILKAWDGLNWLSTVQITGSLPVWVAKIPTSRSLAAVEMIAGRRVAVAFFDPTNNTDAVVFAVYT